MRFTGTRVVVGGLLVLAAGLTGCDRDAGEGASASPSVSPSASPAGVGGTPTVAPSPAPFPPPSWGAPIQVENFNGTTLNMTRWRVYEDPQGNHPRRASNVRVRDGELQLIGRGDASGGMASRLNQLYGRWEVRFRIDRGAGYASAVLLWPEDEKWPAHGEIDLMEVPRADRVLGEATVHYGVADRQYPKRVRSNFDQWHTVAADWHSEQVTLYLDGKVVLTVRRPTDGSFDYIPRASPMHLTLQNDKGCSNFIQCRNAATPAQVIMHVDWAKIYRP